MIVNFWSMTAAHHFLLLRVTTRVIIAINDLIVNSADFEEMCE